METARLATLRGLGTENLRHLNALGIRTMRALASSDWGALDAQLEQMTGDDIVDARVRVWIRGARRALEQG